MEDKSIICKDCSQPFTFTVRDQQFYAEKGFQNEPQRCRDCRGARKGQADGAAARTSHEAICAECGTATTVPFRPRGDRPVYCRVCFAAHAPSPA